MADLSTLMQYAPTTAAGFMGFNQGQQEQYESLKQKELADLINQRQQELSMKQDLHPYELRKAGLNNESLEAKIPGERATSRSLGVTADVDEATKGSKIDAANVANNMKIRQEIGSHLGSFASAVEKSKLPPHAALVDEMRNAGLSDKQMQAVITQYRDVPPAQLAAKMKADGALMLRETPAYVQHMDGIQTQANSHLQGIDKQVAGQQALEKMRIEAGKYNKKDTKITVEGELLKAKTAREKAEKLEQAGAYAEAAGDTESANQYYARAKVARQRAAEDASNLRTGPNIEATTQGRVPERRPEATAPISPGERAPAPAPAGAAQVPPPGAIAKLRANPTLRAAFDAKYGEGYSKRILGN